MFDMIPLVDMAKSKEEIAEESDSMISPAYVTTKYPYGLCLRLDQDDLEKLAMPLNADVGDGIQIMAIARVTSVNKTELADGKCRCSVELQITHLALEGGEAEDEA